MKNWMLMLGLLTFVAMFGLALLSPVHTQQQPYTMYPLQVIADTVLGPMKVDQCLVITAQGHAVVLEYPCPR